MDEQRAPNTISAPDEPPRLTGEALRQQIEALQAQYTLEQEAAQRAEYEANPPRPTEEIVVELLDAISNHIGNPHSVMALMRELHRAVRK